MSRTHSIQVKNIATVTDQDGHIVLVGRGTDGAAWYTREATPGEGDFDAWASLGGPLTDAPAVAVDPVGKITVFARMIGSPDVQVRREDSAGSDTFSEWAAVSTA